MRRGATATSVVVVGAALVIAGVFFVVVVKRTSEDNLERAARLRALDFVALLDSGTPPSEVHIRLQEDVVVQIVDAEGTVVAAGPFVSREVPIAEASAGESRIAEGITDEPEDAFLVAAEGTRSLSEPLLVLVGRDIDEIRETTRVLTTVFAVSIPLLLAIVGLTTWRLVGRALSPVEKIRREVSEISAGRLERRVPEPLTNDEIARLARTMNSMLERLEGSQVQQRRLVSDASHELRNPIAAIRQYAETALTHPDQTSTQGLASEVLEESLRLQVIAEDLLLLARADEEALTIAFRPVDLDDIVLEEATRLRAITTKRVDTSGVSAARVAADRVLLERLIRNLTSNAVRHASSAIALGLRQDGGETTLVVEDDGEGIEVGDRGQVFERFRRLDDARSRRDGGAGLGLAIVSEIAAAHGGSVSIETAALGGARFVVRLPGTG